MEQKLKFFFVKLLSSKTVNLLINYIAKIKGIAELGTISAWQAKQEILKNPRFQNNKRLIPFGFKVYSQADEDGIIQEIFRRIGTTNLRFLEIGVGNGLENNTLSLLLQGWQGGWIDGNPKCAQFIEKKFDKIIAQKKLKFKSAVVDKDNINKLIESLSLPQEIDLLGIDIDGNDYHLFKAINTIKPRVVVIEYNAKFAPPIEWIMKYNPKHLWDGTDYFGVSLNSLERLFNENGYALVGCNIAGTNAFFVRSNLIDNHFEGPYTAKNHYEPARYWLIRGFVSGHPANFGSYTGTTFIGDE